MANSTCNCTWMLLLLMMSLLAGMAWCRSVKAAPAAHDATAVVSSAKRKVTAALVVAPQKRIHKQPAQVALPAASKQLFVLGAGKETSPPDFIRLVVMRLIYGLASTMGLEERLDGVLNGAFVPPNADEGIFSFGDGGYDDGDDGGLDVLFDGI